MHKTRFAAIIAVIIAASAIASGSAMAAQLMAGGKNVSVTATASGSKIDKLIVLKAGELAIECNGLMEEEDIHPTGRILRKKEFSVCFAREPAGCEMPTTLLFVPSEGEATLDGSLAIQAIVKPQTGNVFATISVGGGNCAAAGNKPLTGDFSILMPAGQDEGTNQLSETNQGATGLLKLGSESASLTDAALLLLASHEAWSFL